MDQIIYKSCLVIHIVGITVMAGATFIDMAGFQQFWKNLAVNREKSRMMADNLQRLQRLMGAGMLVIILSGVGMMAYMHQIWGQQSWFRIKMLILLLIIINGLVLRRRLGKQLSRWLDTSGQMTDPALHTLKLRLRWSHLLQLLFFLLIFTLSIFKFN